MDLKLSENANARNEQFRIFRNAGNKNKVVLAELPKDVCSLDGSCTDLFLNVNQPKNNLEINTDTVIIPKALGKPIDSISGI